MTFLKGKVHAESADERAWRDAKLANIDPELLSLAQLAVNRELESRRELNGRLTATITFAGLLLALAFGLGHRVGGLELHKTPEVLLAVSFCAAIALLVVAIGLAIAALQPEPRNSMSPALLQHYGTEDTSPTEVRQDAFKVEVSTLGQLEGGNTTRATRLLKSQRILGLALGVAAAGALILYFCNGETTQRHLHQGNPPHVEKRQALQGHQGTRTSSQATDMGDESP